MSRWLDERTSELGRVSGYQKPARYRKALRLDTNENLALPRSFISTIMQQAARSTDPREYPTEEFDELRASLSRYLGVPEQCIAVGSGSDQIIDLLLSTFGVGVESVTISPTFSFYRDRCSLHSIWMTEVMLDHDFSLDISRILARKRARLCYVCSPNNPTGNQFDKDLMLQLISSFNGLVILDEAYAEFADYSLKDTVRKFRNLVVLRTMSKAFGLAGARVGYMIANRNIAELFTSTIQYPYALSSLSLKAASIALSRMNYVRKVIEIVRKERERIYEGINAVDGLRAFRSDTNFVLFEAGSKYRTVYKGLARKSILVREIGDIRGHRGCLRVSVGTRSMNDRFLRSLGEVCR